MRALVTKFWWIFLLRGLIAIAFGIAAWTWPGLTLATLVLLFGAFAFAGGACAVVAAISGRATHEDWWVLLLEGLAGMLVGALTLFAPGVTTLTLVIYIAAWALVSGFLQIATAIRMRREIRNEGLLIFNGVLTVLFGILMIALPGAGALALLWLIAAFSVAGGLLYLLLAFKVRAVGRAA